MKCPYCQADDTKVVDSRLLKEGFSTRRRRKCETCERRFTTYETIEIHMPVIVKLDGRREPYNRDKLLNGIEKACQKRPISIEQIERVVDNIGKNALEISDKEISSKDVGKLVMQYLRNLDPVAYIRFASVYRKFHDVDEFVHELQHEEQAFHNSTR
jgi:transcriptional repressor NrdR